MHVSDIITVVKAAVEMAILWVVFYRILLFFEGTRAFQVLRGITYLIIALLVSQMLGFEVLNWLLRNFFSIWIIVIVIIFQNELRSGLARLGQQHLFTISLGETEIKALADEIYDTVSRLSRRRHGCLIAIERETKLDAFIESGIVIDGKVSSELLQSIFVPGTPLHDGGVVVRGERVAASSCLFPLSDNPSVGKTVGTRHRAALGLSEHTDALVVLVSEETGEISMAFEGRFMAVHNQEYFMKMFNQVIGRKKNKA
ncbi:MAG: diadenylate cyclase CdaA [Candidatus Omnitrophica bacterium]|nr:diadenylate cyclase CdaA [Candidatus Omnitrophota bacterium]MDE2008882.1 diadenylate cyclase CdaA [Candidatus Omnitrophota bacterium]MDE2213555.1 diadenylate cyclase CdaA [Candidatus Omnitrophota bacterium]MDE2230544.1 diadenylate cyclase CdaA [Candidatus Omnitrophota bacterium]